MKVLLISFVLLFSAGQTLAAEPTKANYDQLAGLARSGQPVDWTALRFARVEKPDFNPYTEGRNFRDGMMKAINDKKYAEALTLAKAALDENYANLLAHMTARIAYKNLGDEAGRARHDKIEEEIVKSIEAGGDGKSSEKPFVVISIAEEYDLMLHYGLRFTQQALVNDNGHLFDVMTAKDKEGKEFSLHFQIDRIFGKWQEIDKAKPVQAPK